MHDEPRGDSATASLIGTIKTIFRFPVKSVGGTAIIQAHVGMEGLLGDRRYAFMDLRSGQLCNAKNPRKYGRLLACRARFIAEPEPHQDLPPLEVEFPDGRTHRNGHGDLDVAMSRYLGFPVRLISTVPEDVTTEIVWDESSGMAKEGVYADATLNASGDYVVALRSRRKNQTFVDLAALHLMTTSTADHLHQLDPAANFDPRRYRPTMVLDTDSPGLVEDTWVGGSLALGDQVSTEVVMSTPRCVMSTLEHAPDVPLDRSTLRSLVKNNTKDVPGWGRWACAGVYGAIAGTGEIRVGDPVRFTEGTPTERAQRQAIYTKASRMRPQRGSEVVSD